MSRSRFFIIYAVIMLLMTIVILMSVPEPLGARLVIVLFFGFLVFITLGAIMLQIDKEQERRSKHKFRRLSNHRDEDRLWSCKSKLKPGPDCRRRPLVSVIMPTYNRALWLPEAIDSVLGQTYPNIELIVVNDGSTDNTEAVLKRYRDRIIYINKKNGGCADAKNAGLKVAKGKYITHLDDDDVMMPERIERLVQFFTENPDFGLCATSAYLIDEKDQVIGIKHLKNVPQKTRLLHLLMSHVAVQSNMMVPKEVFQQVGEYSNVICEDYDMWLRIGRYYEIGVIEEPLVKYRKHPNQITALKNHNPLMASLQRINLLFLKTVPMEEIIPALQSPAVGHALIGALLCRHKLFDSAYDEIRRAPKDGTAQLWLAMLVLYQRDFDQARRYLQQVPPNHPCSEHIPQAFALIDEAERICGEKTAKDNNSDEVIKLRSNLQRLNLCFFNNTLKSATGGQTCLQD